MARRRTTAASDSELGSVPDPRGQVTAATATLEQLRAQEARVIAIRDAAVVALHVDGLSYQQIAEMAGLTRGRVAQIVGRSRAGSA